jgi:hypothetical protein
LLTLTGCNPLEQSTATRSEDYRVSQRQDSRVFGKRPKHSHTIIFASGETIRHITVRPWMAGLLMSVLGVMAIGYLAATSYLVLRDDLIGASMARQARMQHAYEDRIAALRSQVDRVTSRQLLDQQLMEEKVAELIARQDALSNRHGKLGPLLDRAGAAAGRCRSRSSNPKKQAQLPGRSAENRAPCQRSLLQVTIVSDPAEKHRINPPPLHPYPSQWPQESVSERADRIFSTVTLSLKSIEREQIEKMQGLAIDALKPLQRSARSSNPPDCRCLPMTTTQSAARLSARSIPECL